MTKDVSTADMFPRQPTETEIKAGIKQYLRLKGWFCYHNLAGIGSYGGLPDIAAIKDGRVIQIEAKRPKGIQSDLQKDFENQWKRHGGEYMLIRSVQDLIDAGL